MNVSKRSEGEIVYGFIVITIPIIIEIFSQNYESNVVLSMINKMYAEMLIIFLVFFIAGFLGDVINKRLNLEKKKLNSIGNVIQVVVYSVVSTTLKYSEAFNSLLHKIGIKDFGLRTFVSYTIAIVIVLFLYFSVKRVRTLLASEK